MPDFTRYQLARKAHQCTACRRASPTPLCDACRERQRHYNAASYQRYKVERAAQREALLLDRPHEIAHCGQWQLFISLPVRCEKCKKTLLEKAS